MRGLVGGWCFLMMACADGTATNPEDGAQDSAAVDTVDTGFTGPIETDDVDRSASLASTVQDESGAPLEGAEIRFCRALVCRTGTTDGAGRVAFDDVEVDWHSFEVQPPKGQNGLAIAYAPLVFDTEESRDITMVLPALDTPTNLPATTAEEIEAGTGLFVTVAASDLEPPLFEEEPTTIAGVLLEEAQLPPVDLDREVVAMWFMRPFDYVAEKGLPLRFANQWELKDGETYEVWVGSYLDQAWLPSGTVTVKGDSLTGDAKLGLVSTVMLTKPKAE